MNKPLLRWAGSKRKLLPFIAPYFVGSNRYVEPFAGSASLFFSLTPNMAVLGDINQELINFYNIVKTNYVKLKEILNTFSKSQSDYYSIRNKQNEDLTQVQQAARFLYLNRYCFNGLYRTNNDGRFNVPYGGQKTGDLPTLEELSKASLLFQNVTLLHDDFENVVRKYIRQGDHIYLDPPYSIKNKKIFTQYGPSTFGQEDLYRLIQLLEFIDDCGASFVLSYAVCDEMREILSKWNSKIVETQRNIAGFSHKRVVESEYLITNMNIK